MLINGMADIRSWVLSEKSSCNEFGRPFKLEFFHDIATDERISYSLPLYGVMFTFNGSLMCPIGQVNFVKRRSIPSEFS
jgi:hypothetical protein